MQKTGKQPSHQMTTIDELLAAGLEHHRAARWHQAETAYRQILQVNPRHPEALHLSGLIAHQFGQHQAGLELILGAIDVRGDVAVFHNSLGECYRSLGRYSQAIECYCRALSLRPDLAEAHNNLGTAYQAIGQLAEAIACFDRAIGLRHDYVNAHYNRARVWLTQGNFSAGWPEYEWRWQRAEFHRPVRPEPQWDGSSLDGRTLLVECEQGLGDTLQFIRYVELMHDRGDNLLVEMQPSLIPLLRDSGFDNLIAQGQPLPRCDARVSLLSLPGHFRTTVETIPAKVPYLASRADRIERWRQVLSEISHPRVGIHWQGNPRSPLEPWRSIPLAAFEPLAHVDGAGLVSLQKGAGAEQLAAIGRQFAIVDLGPQLDEYAGAFIDTAAVIKGLDLVITSDSAVAHLAGALGVPVWVALNVGSDWRWMQNRADSPWYPTMRLFRQPRLGDWAAVFRTMARELLQFCSDLKPRL
jgi:tetratricopeptide (TPR) repeat protein